MGTGQDGAGPGRMLQVSLTGPGAAICESDRKETLPGDHRHRDKQDKESTVTAICYHATARMTVSAQCP